jgi:sRNA-binding protein
LSSQKDAVQTAESWFYGTFKTTFDPIQPLPLACGINKAALKLMPPHINPAELACFLKKWTRQAAYLKALAEPGAMRYDLDGQSIEPVKDTHKKWAEEMLQKKLS